MGVFGMKRPDVAARNRENKKHGMEGTPTYKTWRAMRSRCQNTDDKDYKNYGARGISVCLRWEEFAAFVADMGVRPLDATIDRIDVNGNYEPSNCRWATAVEQSRNKRQNVMVSFNGKTQCIAAWADEIGLERKTLEYRIRAGWNAERALTSPSLIKRK